MIRMQAGAVFASHKHLAPADFMILKGTFKYRMGEASEGAYGYEPNGAIHETALGVMDGAQKEFTAAAA